MLNPGTVVSTYCLFRLLPRRLLSVHMPFHFTTPHAIPFHYTARHSDPSRPSLPQKGCIIIIKRQPTNLTILPATSDGSPEAAAQDKSNAADAAALHPTHPSQSPNISPEKLTRSSLEKRRNKHADNVTASRPTHVSPQGLTLAYSRPNHITTEPPNSSSRRPKKPSPHAIDPSTHNRVNTIAHTT